MRDVHLRRIIKPYSPKDEYRTMRDVPLHHADISERKTRDPALTQSRRRGARGRAALIDSPGGRCEIASDLRQIEHPEGRFKRDDGTRYDICVMEVWSDPGLRPPAVPRCNFVGDRADSDPGVIRLGNVKQVSFRPRLISPATPLQRAEASAV